MWMDGKEGLYLPEWFLGFDGYGCSSHRWDWRGRIRTGIGGFCGGSVCLFL